MIDGQQRITALMTSIVGLKVIDKDYKDKIHKISFNPYAAAEGEPCFEVQSAAILKDKRWISDISELFSNDFSSLSYIKEFCNNNLDMNPLTLEKLIKKVQEIKNAPIGVINLAPDLSIDKVTEIFIRINSKGASLTEADFVMSTLAADEQYGGNLLRKAIDYFCHLQASSSFLSNVDKDTHFVNTSYYESIKWVANSKSYLFNMTFDDVLRVAYMTTKYYRGKISSLTDLLHGRNFELRTYEEQIKEDSFNTLAGGIKCVFDKYTHEQFAECLKSAGFVERRLIKGRMALDFAYMLFIRLHQDTSVEKLKVSHYVQRWYVMSLLTGRYASSPETAMDADLRAIRDKGFLVYFDEVMANLSDTFWNVTLVQKLETTSVSSPSFLAFLASQCKNVDVSLLNKGAKVRDLLDSADIHHIFPKQYLKDVGLTSPTVYNQIANYVCLSRPVNIVVGKKAPKVYFGDIMQSIEKGKVSTYTTIQTKSELYDNLRENAIPLNVVDMDAENYSDFLMERRKLMAEKIKKFFYSL